MLGIRTILHPTDFSPLARHAFEVACALAQDYKARLVLLHVHEPQVPLGELVPTESPDIREYLMRELQGLETPPDVAVDHQLEIGPVAEGILCTAAETKCDLIVIGTHGRGGLGRVLLGSVAESVLRKAPCMVLTVKGEAPGGQPNGR
jgi:nucleotide-binding universal stress UspA family protein